MLDEFTGNSRFSIIRRLGAGGMGIVYEAEDRERNTRVALKTLRNVDPASIYRFKVEFRSLAELSHENLLPLYELFFEDDHWFFTMELLEGASDLLSFIHGRGPALPAHAASPSPGSGARPEGSRGQSGDSAPTLAFPSDPGSAPTAFFSSERTARIASGAPRALDSYSQSEPTMLVVSDPAHPWTPGASDAATTQFESDPTLLLTVQERAASGASPAVHENSAPAAAQSAATEFGAGKPRGECDPAGAGRPLDVQPLDYGRLRRAFLTVAQGVRALHAAGKLHRDLKPENVMVRADGRPVLLDFGLILDLKLQAPAAGDPQHKPAQYKPSSDQMISGTLAYMAPEQATGSPLLNSSDWYAFGVMLYQALTGRLPITGKGIEVLRAKLVQDPPPPSRFAPSTPPDLDQLCAALLSRNPARRPTGAEIVRCLSGESSIVDQDDSNQNFFIGRSSYLAELEASLAALQQGLSQVLCVHGRSGVGKTALLQHFLALTGSSSNAILLEGRCYEQESVPYKAVDNLVDALTQHLLDMPAESLRAVLPRDIHALARVFPVLKRVGEIGGAAVATVADNPLMVRQQAFDALGQLLRAIGSSSPLILHIDDLQWGDLDSAQLLAGIFAMDEPPRMLVLLSYRSEYAANPCLREFRRAWESGKLTNREMEVLPLTKEESRALAAELLAGTPAAAAQIDRIVEQANGSAFFVQELAEHARSGMDWHAGSVATGEASPQDAASGQAGDLDEVLWRRVQRLPEEARQLIEIVAVAGQPILIGDLAHTRLFASIPQHAVKLLRSARLVRSTGGRLSDEIETFHDRVRESIAKFLPEPVSRDYHQQIADALEVNEQAAPETIASHLQSAQSPRAAHFFELAGERAIQVLAFDRAEEYLKLAVRLAPADADRVRVETRLVHFYTDTARFQDAYSTGVDAVARFGVKLPRKFNPPLLVANMIQGLVRKGRRKPLDFLDLPVMRDERLTAVVNLIAAMAKAAYQVRPEICVTICTMAVNLCLKYGNTSDAAIVYMVFGCIFLGGILGRAETGYEFGRLALGLVDKFHNDRQRAEVNFVVGYFGTSWVKPAVGAEELWQVAFNEGQRTGDLFHTGCAVSGTIQGMIMRGAPLGQIEQRLEEYWPVVERAHLREPMTCLECTRRLLARLRAPGDASPSEPEDRRLLAELANFGSRHFAHFHFLNQCMLHALAGNVPEGLKAAAQSAAYLPDSKGLLNAAEHCFWSAMLHAMDPAAKSKAIKEASAARKKFAGWTSHCPTNFAQRRELLAAEEARLRRKLDAAMDHYRRAIFFGERYRCLHLLAFANQRAAELAVGLGLKQEAAQFAAAATHAYQEWGADALAAAGHLPAQPALNQPAPNQPNPERLP